MASVSSTYARALADVVFDRRLPADKILGEVQSLAELVAGNGELRQVWEAPSISAAQKRAVLDAISVREGFSPEVRNFVAVLIDHGRIDFLSEIVKQFEQELNLRLGFVEAKVSSARDLNAQERKTLESEILKLTGKKVQAQYFREPSLLGGAVVRVGSTIYDGSISGQLEKIREKIAAGS